MSDYELIDSGEQRKLERFGEYRLVRPASQAVWSRRDPGAWRDADSTFERASSGTGRWQGRPLPEEWRIQHAGLTWHIRPNEHGNTGVFAEQEECWKWIAAQVRAAGDSPEVINLFGYTGGSTLAAARAGARVCHVDASPTSVRQARANADASGAGELPVRWITEDAQRFVEREVRRERRYQGIVLDPPTFGRGPKGETWKIDEHLRGYLARCREIFADQPRFMLLTSHTPGYTPWVLHNLLSEVVPGPVESGEMLIQDAGGRALPSGAWARWGRA